MNEQQGLDKTRTWRRLKDVNRKAQTTTYGLLIRSQERGRSALEIAVYGLVALSTLITIWQFAQQASRLDVERTFGSTAAMAVPVNGAGRI
jgi:hypothetical protein